MPLDRADPAARRGRLSLRTLVLGAAADLSPSYFALVMATGVVSIGAHQFGLGWIAQPLLAINILAYAALLLLLLVRVARFPRRIVEDLIEHARGPGFFTVVAGTCVLGSQLYLVAGARAVATVLWYAGVVSWFVIMYAFFTAVMVRSRKPDLETGINGAWLIAAVATQSVCVLGTLIARDMPYPDLAWFVALCMYLLGCLLYLSIITLILYRLTFIRVTVIGLTPPYWINMGAVAIATLAGSGLILSAPDWHLLMELRPFLKGFTLFFWTAATWWIPLLLGLSVWRHLIMRHPVRYDPQLWGMAFPLGMYAAGTLRLAEALDLPFLVLIPRLFIVIAVLVWGLTALGLVFSLVRAIREVKGMPWALAWSGESQDD